MMLPQGGIGARLKALLDLSPRGSQIALAIFFLAGSAMVLASVFYEREIGPKSADRLFWFGVVCCVFAWISWLLSHRDQDLAGAHPTTATFEVSGQRYEISVDPRSRTLETHIASLLTTRVSGIMFAQPPVPAGMVGDDMRPLPNSDSDATKQAETAQKIATEQRERLLGKDYPYPPLPSDAVALETADTTALTELLARAPLATGDVVRDVAKDARART